MLGFVTSLLTGGLLGSITDVAKAFINKEITIEEYQSKVAGLLVPAIGELAKAQRDVIMAEATSESWIARNWRPMVAIAFGFIPFFYGLIVPILVGWFGMPSPRVGDELLKWIMDAVVICLGGYIGGRSLEKIATSIGSFFAKRDVTASVAHGLGKLVKRK